MFKDVIEALVNLATLDHPERQDIMDRVFDNFKKEKVIIGVYASILAMPDHPVEDRDRDAMNKILYNRMCSEIKSVSLKIIKENMSRFSRFRALKGVVTKEDYFPNIFDGTFRDINIDTFIQYLADFRTDVGVLGYVLFENLITASIIFPYMAGTIFTDRILGYLPINEIKR